MNYKTQVLKLNVGGRNFDFPVQLILERFPNSTFAELIEMAIDRTRFISERHFLAHDSSQFEQISLAIYNNASCKKPDNDILKLFETFRLLEYFPDMKRLKVKIDREERNKEFHMQEKKRLLVEFLEEHNISKEDCDSIYCFDTEKFEPQLRNTCCLSVRHGKVRFDNTLASLATIHPDHLVDKIYFLKNNFEYFKIAHGIAIREKHNEVILVYTPEKSNDDEKKLHIWEVKEQGFYKNLRIFSLDSTQLQALARTDYIFGKTLVSREGEVCGKLGKELLIPYDWWNLFCPSHVAYDVLCKLKFDKTEKLADFTFVPVRLFCEDFITNHFSQKKRDFISDHFPQEEKVRRYVHRMQPNKSCAFLLFFKGRQKTSYVQVVFNEEEADYCDLKRFRLQNEYIPDDFRFEKGEKLQKLYDQYVCERDNARAQK